MDGVTAQQAAVLVPGGGNTAGGPFLAYAMEAVERHGAHAHRIVWTPPADWQHSQDWVAAQVAAAIDETSSATRVAAPAVIGKSLGSMAAPLVAERGLPAVWFTPLLTDEPTLAGLRRASAPCLLVGGTADPYWDGAAARSVTGHVVEVEEADHSLFVPGPLSASAAVLGQVITAVEEFLDQVVWP